MPTQIFSPPILVGFLGRMSVGETWANIISGAGTGATDNGTISPYNIQSSLVANLWTVNERSIFIFDTSILATFGTTILTAARLRLNVTFKDKTFAFNPDFNIYGSTPASDYSLLPADYQRIGNIPYCDTPLPYNLTVIGWNTFTLNTTGLAAIKKSGHTSFGIRNANYDVAAISPAWAAGKATSIAIDGAGFLNPPILEVDFIVKPINSFIKKKFFTTGQI